MPNVNDVGDRATKWIRWIARIWGTLIVAFTLLMLIGYAWNWVTTGKEGLGGAITVVFNLAALPVLLIHWPITHDFPRYLVAPYGTWMIIAIPGILFLMCWWRSKKRVIPQHGA